MLSILTDIWVRVQKEKQNHQEIHTYEGIYTRALALLNCGSWLNSTWSLWLLCLVQKPEVSRAGSHSHAEVKQGQDGTARIIRICKGGPEPASPPLSASPPLRCLTPSEVPHPFWDPSSDDDGVLQMKLMFFIRELNAHLAQGCEKLKEEIQQAQMPPHANQWANRSVTTSTCCSGTTCPVQIFQLQEIWLQFHSHLPNVTPNVSHGPWPLWRREFWEPSVEHLRVAWHRVCSSEC